MRNAELLNKLTLE
jgi:hypothetical protein